jgi:hypothetical protein
VGILSLGWPFSVGLCGVCSSAIGVVPVTRMSAKSPPRGPLSTNQATRIKGFAAEIRPHVPSHHSASGSRGRHRGDNNCGAADDRLGGRFAPDTLTGGAHSDVLSAHPEQNASIVTFWNVTTFLLPFCGPECVF